MMKKSHRNIDPELLRVNEEDIKRQITRIADDVLKEVNGAERPQPSTRTRIKAEAKGIWTRLKDQITEAVEPLWEQKEEIIITVATKLIKGWIERKLKKF